MNWTTLANKALEGTPPTEAESLAVLRAGEEEVLGLVAAAFRVRRAYHGRRVKLNLLVNAKSGLCPEDCAYCSQSSISTAQINRYRLLSRETLLEGAARAVELQSHTYCIVMSGRSPSAKEVDEVTATVREIKQKHSLKICCCLGLLSAEQAALLQEAGVDRVNHNLNAAESFHEDICSTHTFRDRVATIENVKKAKLSPCCGGIFGMGESDSQIIELARSLRELDVDSIPLNFLIPIPGTPLADRPDITPAKCLAILCLFRFWNPTKEIRIAGGREVHLRSLQPLGLYVADSIFIGNYLTTDGQAPEQDLQMIRDLGFEVARFETPRREHELASK
ncbi:MAG: biotin synthase BioB [Acidobacteria bacterium]|nr:biotin synthase BioB [Acidobacteriota bacterium]